MKVVLLYIRVLHCSDPNFVIPKDYDQSSQRFLSTYIRYKPKYPHELVVVNCGSENHDGMFDGVAARYETDMGGGFDCGTYKHIGARQSCDLVVGLNTHTHFWREGWLEPFVQCAEKFGPGIYGPCASYEQNPHIRTPCIAFSPTIMQRYPYPVETRLQAGEAEFGPNNFTLWSQFNNFPCRLVTEHASYTMKVWRTTKNGFRQGNQSDCLVFDRHTEIYAKADKATKLHLQMAANGVKV